MPQSAAAAAVPRNYLWPSSRRNKDSRGFSSSTITGNNNLPSTCAAEDSYFTHWLAPNDLHKEQQQEGEDHHNYHHYFEKSVHLDETIIISRPEHSFLYDLCHFEATRTAALEKEGALQILHHKSNEGWRHVRFCYNNVSAAFVSLVPVGRFRFRVLCFSFLSP